MPFTIKQLAKLSGVSTRTLRFYDELGLLKPAYYGDNQYRYYEEEQLLLLQQILFYRELDFPLQDIQQILKNDTFDKISSLKQHQSMLKKSNVD
jgi:DNA-binding transcriptional MerR regulator